MKTRISLITPSYNQGMFIEQTLKSVCSQRRFLHEYFVVDGGSTDESVSIIKRYEKNIDWWVSEKDKGQTDAIMKGFARANGDVLAWINSDDIYLPNALEAVQAAFDSDPSLELLTGYMAQIDGESRVLHMRRVPAPDSQLMKRGFVYVTQPTTFFRRSLYDRVGGLDRDLHCGMDMDLWCRFFRARPKWKTLPQYVVGFREHTDNKGMSPKWKQIYEAEGALVKSRYPELHHDSMGRVYYVARQILSGRKALSALHTYMYRGRSVYSLPGRLFGL